LSTAQVESGKSEYEVRHEVFDREILIKTTHFKVFDGPKACRLKASDKPTNPHDELFRENCTVKDGTIDDKDAKKAREKDQKHLARLQSLRAYKQAIRNYVLPRTRN
jgi:hypothetical protein